MGYGSYIKNNEVHEWSDYYVQYTKLSKIVGTKSFKEKISNEITKVNGFYMLLEGQAIREKHKIVNELKGDINEDLYNKIINIGIESSASVEIPNMTENGNIGENYILNQTKHAEEDEHLSDIDFLQQTDTETKPQLGALRFIVMPGTFQKRKREKHITEFLHSLVKIKSYRDINVTAITKLIKRHKLVSQDNQDYSDLLKTSYFYTSKTTEKIKAAIKRIYKGIFAKNNPSKAKRIYNRIKKGFVSSDILYIIAGFLSGINCVLSTTKFPETRFFAVNNLFLGFILFGLCMKIFKISKVNYKFIYNFDYSSDLNNARFLVTVSLLNLFYILYDKFAKYDGMYLVALGVLLFILIIPFDVFFCKF